MIKHNLVLVFIIAGLSNVLFAQKKPNIILIMSDDMGYSDLGCFGSEIQTPNLDALANKGLKFTQFYNQSRCCPARAALMTGLYPHQTGMGWMDRFDHQLPGYRGQLTTNCVTIAEVLKSSGYHTYMSGKWHLQLQDEVQENSPKNNWPLQRGFDEFYGILKGSSDYYNPTSLCRNNTLITAATDPAYSPKEYYFTNAVTDNALKYIQKEDGKQPFFLYLAYTAAHWPIQAPAQEIEKYKGKYDKGWDEIRKARLEKMKKLGLIDKKVELAPLDYMPWEQEIYQPAMARRMETYAAMVDIMDQGIGSILDELKRKGIDKNTIILYMQDNGGCAENIGLKDVKDAAGNIISGKAIMAGPSSTFISYLQPWAQVSNTPFKKYKHDVYEGGISTPLIINWPAGIKAKGEYRNQMGNLIDILPTLVELSGSLYPKTYKGNKITPLDGVSLVPAFKNKTMKRTLFWEHEMNKAIRQDDWKLVSTGKLLQGNYGDWKYYKNGKWELYNMREDRTELKDLSDEYPNLVKKMAVMWHDWAIKTKVFPTPWKEIKSD